MRIVYPVAVAEQSWTVGAGNLLPWVEEAYGDQPLPDVLTDADGGATFPYEEIIAAAPDLILAPGFATDKQTYDKHSKLAPTIPNLDNSQVEPWDKEVTVMGQILGKEAEAKRMQERRIEHVAACEREELAGEDDGFVYEEATVRRDEWTMMLGDSAERIREIPDNSVDLSVFSPPFLSLFTSA